MARLGSRFELLVVDEVHHFGGSIRDEALEMCAAPWRMGLTATPAVGPAEARLDDLVGPAVFQLGLGDLAGVWLADLDVVVLRLRLTPEERLRYEADVLRFRSVYAAFRRSMPGGAWTDFVAAAQRSADGQAALRCWRRARRGLARTSGKRQAVSDLLSRHRDQRVLV
ncbi:MAG TPA: DEAD/DEAH box helicase family protein, partial [Polyangiaceae bacterium]|nr:DEAD/DEAH box helicase family protein [Polyangiaceae bacterium]